MKRGRPAESGTASTAPWFSILVRHRRRRPLTRLRICVSRRAFTKH